MEFKDYLYNRNLGRLQNGSVTVGLSDITIIQTIPYKGTEKLTLITLNAFGYQYAVKNGTGVLYTTDAHGNPDRQSVFTLDINLFHVEQQTV